MPNNAGTYLELYRRYQDTPFDPILLDWWNDLDYDKQEAVSELYKREKRSQYEADSIKTAAPDPAPKSTGLVEEILKSEPLDPKLFKQTRRRAPLELPTEPGTAKFLEYIESSGKVETLGVVQVKPDGSMEIVDDLKKVNLIMMEDRAPASLTIDQTSDWVKDLQNKAKLESEGYRLYNLDTGKVIEPEVKPYKAPTLARNRYVNQWQSFVNRFPKSFKNFQLSNEMMMELGFHSEERVKEIAQLNAEIQGIKSSQAYEEFQNSRTFGEALRKLSIDPIEIGAQITVESLSQFLPAYAEAAIITVPVGAGIGGAIGSIPGLITGGTYGLYTAAGIASFGLEFTGMILETMSEHV